MSLLLAISLVGLWGSERVLGAPAGGELTLVREGDRFTASVGGFVVPAHREGNSLRFQLPGGRGQFRGAPGDLLRGHFLQPYLPTAGARMATPVTLHALSPAAWRGEIAPLQETFAVYLFVWQEPGGALRAVVRNPEQNALRGRTLTVGVDGASVRLLDGASEVASGTLQGDRLTLISDRLQGTLVLTRRGRDDAPGFYPRTPPASYVYRAPLADGDGWPTATLADVGLDARPIAAMVQKILDADPGATSYPWVQGILVARHGKLVLEEYFSGFSEDRLHDLRSAQKSFSTTLVGIAGVDVQAKIASFFPDVAAEKRGITVEHLLTMSSGLACDDDDDDSPGNEDRMRESAQDYHRYTLDLPLAHPPGSFAAYCSATINLLGGVVRRLTGAWLVDLFADRIARPLQFGRYAVNLAPDGDMYLAGGLRLRPRDFLKLGQTFLDGGVWNGARVVEKSWVDAAVAPHARLKNGQIDGYNWWLRDVGGVHTYEAGGNGGQFVYVAPELDLAVAFTGGSYGAFGGIQRTDEELLVSYVFAAARSSAVRAH